MCSGAMVFLFSCSHISFASEDIKWMNSAMIFSVIKAVDGNEGRLLFTYTTFYHQITRFLSTYDIVG